MVDLHPPHIERYLAAVLAQPVRLTAVTELGGVASGEAALKAFGYGQPLRLDVEVDGAPRSLVLRRVRRNAFGHERGADRAAAAWLDFETFNRLPRHVRVTDLAGLTQSGSLESFGQVQELLLLTDYVPGLPYAQDLLRVRDTGEFGDLDVRRAAALGAYLAEIHAVGYRDSLLWRRRLRDLVGHGEGVMGLTESYPADDPIATPALLQGIEEAANRWRWRLRGLDQRLCQVHGDFHPFNVLFTTGEEFNLLDRSRGEWGEAADDVSCMAINYLFFSLQRAGCLTGAFAELYRAFWSAYLERRPDPDLASVAPPWFAWRALVLASPQWYPTIAASVRRQLISFAQNVLAAESFQWQEIDRYLS